MFRLKRHHWSYDVQIPAASLHGGVHEELRHQLLLSLDPVLQQAASVHAVKLSPSALASGFGASYSASSLCSSVITHHAVGPRSPASSDTDDKTDDNHSADASPELPLPLTPAVTPSPIPEVSPSPPPPPPPVDLSPWLETLLVVPGARSVYHIASIHSVHNINSGFLQKPHVY